MDTTIIGEFNLNRIRTILPEIKRQSETKKDFICPAWRLPSQRCRTDNLTRCGFL